MPVSVRGALVALLLLLVLPSVASAQRGPGGGYDYESLGCSSERIVVKSGRCDSRRPAPEIFSTPSAPRAGAAVRLRASSAGRGLTFAWDLDDDGAFDDGNGATVSRSFPAGKPRVRVRATDDDGRTGETTTTLHVHASNLAPVGTLYFNRSNPRVGQAITVSAFAYDEDGLVRRLELDADGNGAYEVTQEFPDAEDAELDHAVTYPSAGVRTVRLRITDDGGVMTVATASVDVHAQNLAPVVSLAVSPAEPRVGRPIRFSASGFDADGTIAKREFDLDGNGSYETAGGPDGSVTTSFATAASRVVGVRVTDDGGATAVSRRTLVVKQGNDAPTIQISTSGARSLYALATDDDRIVQYAWDLDGDGVFDDAIGEFAAFVTLPPDAIGEIEVAVRVTDNEGAAATARHIVSLHDQPPSPPSINHSPPQPRAGQSIQFFVNYESDTSVEWDTDNDGVFEPGTGSGISKTFPIAGTYPIYARARDSKGRVATSRHNVTVSPATGNLAPVAYISGYATARTGVPVSLFGSGQDDGQISSYAWELDGDGDFDDDLDSQATTTFTTTGDHDVGLRVTDDQGMITTQYKTIEVHTDNRAPRVFVGTSTPVAGTLVLRQGQQAAFSGAAISTDDPIAGWAWDIDGDGFDDGTDVFKEVTFTQVGLHRIRVRATDSGGLTGTAVQLVDVRPDQPNHAPKVSLGLPFGSVRPGTPVNLSAIASDADGDTLTYAWDADGDGQFDDGTSSFITFSYATAKDYDVSVRVSDGRGGERVAMQTLNVAADAGLPPVIEDFGFFGIVRVGRPSSFGVYAYTNGGFGASLTYEFDMDGDGVFDDTPTGSFGFFQWTFPASNRVTVSVRVKDAAGNSAVRSVEVVPGAENLAPTAYIDSGPLIAGQPATLYAEYFDPDASGFPSAAWDLDNDGEFDDSTEPVVTTPPLQAGTYTVGLQVTDGEGAVGTVTRTVTVGTRPPLATFTVSDLTPDLGQQVTLASTATDPDGGAIASRAWDLDDDGAFDDGTGAVAHVAYSTAGARLVGLKVRDGGGDTGIAYVRLVAVRPAPPQPTVTPTPETTPDPVILPAPIDGGPVTPADTSAPVLTAAPRAPKLAQLIKSGLPVKVGCSEACSVTVVASVDKATAKRLKLGRTLEVGRAVKQLAAGQTATLSVKLSAKARKAVKQQRSLKLKLTITAVDSAGNRRQTTKSVTVRR